MNLDFIDLYLCFKRIGKMHFRLYMEYFMTGIILNQNYALGF